MFHIIFIVKENAYENFEIAFKELLERNLHYDKLIIYFINPTNKNKLNNHILYILNKAKIEIYEPKECNINIQLIMNDIAHIYNGLCTYIFVDKLNDTSNLILNIIDSIQNCLNHGIYIKSSKNIFLNKEEINNYVLEKTFYEQYKYLFEKNPYYDISIISFHYQHVWIKKLFFELKYLENVKSENDFNYLLNLLYYKYVSMYAKVLLA
jgi:hypothetical protein